MILLALQRQVCCLTSLFFSCFFPNPTFQSTSSHQYIFSSPTITPLPTAPTMVPTSIKVAVDVTLSFSGLTQSVIVSDSSGSIKTALLTSIKAALGITAKVAADTAVVSDPSWSYGTIAALSRTRNLVTSTAAALVSIKAVPSDISGGSSAIQIAATLTS